jgi:hypothetical protein
MFNLLIKQSLRTRPRRRVIQIRDTFFTLIIGMDENQTLGEISSLLSNYLGSVLPPVSTCHILSKLSASRLSGNCHAGMGECQILGQSNPALHLLITKENESRISLPNWLSNCHAAMLSKFGESPPPPGRPWSCRLIPQFHISLQGQLE